MPKSKPSSSSSSPKPAPPAQKDMGKVMGALKAQYAGQLDMGKAGAVVKQKLG
jgi:uncharacterized protein YqeY